MLTDRKLSLFLPVAVTLALVLAKRAPAEDTDEVIPLEAREVIDAVELDQLFYAGWSEDRAPQTSAETQLRQEIAFLNRIVTLSDAQRKKLELAGRIDIERFVEEIHAARRHLPTRGVTRAEIVQIARQADDLQRRLLDGAYGEGSLLEKTLRTTLDAHQFTLLETHVAAEAKSRHRSRIHQMLSVLDDYGKWTPTQHHDAASLLAAHTKPPRRGQGARAYEREFMKSVGEVPADEWTKIFSGAELVKLSRVLDRVRSAVHGTEVPK